MKAAHAKAKEILKMKADRKFRNDMFRKRKEDTEKIAEEEQVAETQHAETQRVSEAKEIREKQRMMYIGTVATLTLACL